MVECVSRICRLCLDKCNEFEMIDRSHRDYLKGILPNTDLTMSNEPVLCKNCIYNLENWYSFKTASLYIKNHRWMTKEGATMEACLFCKKIGLFDSFITLNSEQSSFRSIVEEYFPEMNIHKNTCPIVCVLCYEFVQENFGFIFGCLSVENEIKTFRKMLGTHNKSHVDLRSVVDFISTSKVKDEQCNRSVIEIEEKCDKTKSKIDSCNSVKKENEDEVTEIDIKVEPIWNEEGNKIIDQNIVKTLPEPNPENIFDEINIKALSQEIKAEEIWLCEKNEVEDTVNTISESIEAVVRKRKYNGDSILEQLKLSFDKVVPNFYSMKENAVCNNMKQKGTESELVAEHTRPSRRIVQIDETKCGNSRPNNLLNKRKKWWFNAGGNKGLPTFPKSELRALITRICISGVNKYQCQVCQFIAKAKCSMNRHMIIHQNDSELNNYQCHQCDFKSKRKDSLVQHMHVHRETPLYSCHNCTFETRTRKKIRLHMVKHNNGPDVRMFECHTCGYKSRYKSNFIRHVDKHKPISVPAVYKCDKCSYQTLVKFRLKAHLRVHLHPSEVTMYKCDFCDYETKYKGTCAVHMERHREPVTCKYCPYNTRFTSKLNRHMRKWHDIVVSKKKNDRGTK